LGGSDPNNGLPPIRIDPTLPTADPCNNAGRIAERSAEAQQFRASGLNLVIAAIVYWNATYLEDALVHLRAAGELVPDELLPHTSPLSCEHISLSGDFLWERAAAFAPERRSLNLAMRRAVA
jgi:hypothetical protein